MLLPKNEICQYVIRELTGCKDLDAWETDFVNGNKDRKEFTDLQREKVGELMKKYDV